MSFLISDIVASNDSDSAAIDIEQSYGKYGSYVALGLILIFANAVIVLDILRHRVLRIKKEYLILAGKY